MVVIKTTLSTTVFYGNWVYRWEHIVKARALGFFKLAVGEADFPGDLGGVHTHGFAGIMDRITGVDVGCAFPKSGAHIEGVTVGVVEHSVPGGLHYAHKIFAYSEDYGQVRYIMEYNAGSRVGYYTIPYHINMHW